MHRYRSTSIAALLLLSACSGQGLGRQPIAHNAATAPITPIENPEVQQPPTAEATTSTTEATPGTVPTTEAPTTTVVVTAPPTTRVRVTTTALSYEPSGEWAIPTYIVMCESGGDWMAYNPASGASGPYQLMPMHFGGALAMHQSRAAQHAKAAELWDGGRGRNHWRDCL